MSLIVENLSIEIINLNINSIVSNILNLLQKEEKFMSSNNIEMMRKIIEEKKKKSSEQSGLSRPDKVIGKQKKAARSTKKTGGLFDK